MSIIYLVKVPYHYSLLFLISSFFFFTSRVNSISFSLLSSLLSFDFSFHHYFSFFSSSIASSLSSSFSPFLPSPSPTSPLTLFPFLICFFQAMPLTGACCTTRAKKQDCLTVRDWRKRKKKDLKNKIKKEEKGNPEFSFTANWWRSDN